MKIVQAEWVARASKHDFDLLYSECKPALSLATQEALISGLKGVMPNFDVAQYFGSQPTIFADYEHLVVAIDPALNPIGLLGARWFNSGAQPFLYLWTAMIGDAYRRTALFRSIVAYCFEQVASRRKFPGIIATKTYNPVVYSIMQNLARGVPGAQLYPNIPGAQTPEMLDLAASVARVVCPSLRLDLDTGVVVGGQAVLAPDFFPEMQRTEDGDVFRHFQNHLTRDDQVLCVARLSDEAGAKLVARLRAQNEQLAATPQAVRAQPSTREETRP